MAPIWQLALVVLPVLVVQLGSIALALINRKKLDQVHDQVNGTMQDLLQKTAETHYARGVEAGRAMHRKTD